MNIVFMGTPDFAVAALERLASCHNVMAVFTQPDKPKNRGKKMQAPPVKECAEKLGIPQVTYAEEIIKVENGVATIKRRLKNGVETVEAPLPLVVTVNGSAAPCRPRNARFVQKYKYAVTPSEKANLGEDMLRLVDSREYLNLYEWDEKVVEADVEQIGLAGSPTKVKGIENVVFTAKESKVLDGGNDAEIEDLIKELITNHTIG